MIQQLVESTYTITYELNQSTSDVSTTEITSGESFTCNITPNDGYKLSVVTVTMNGVDVTSSVYSDGVVNISEVEGNIVITVTCVKDIVLPSSDSPLTYIEDGYLYMNMVDVNNEGLITLNRVATYETQYNNGYMKVLTNISNDKLFALGSDNPFNGFIPKCEDTTSSIEFSYEWLSNQLYFYIPLELIEDSTQSDYIHQIFDKQFVRTPWKIGEYVQEYTLEITSDVLTGSQTNSTVNDYGFYNGFFGITSTDTTNFYTLTHHMVNGYIYFNNRSGFCKYDSFTNRTHEEYSIQIGTRLLYNIPSEQYPSGLTADDFKSHLEGLVFTKLMYVEPTE